jgi:TetR/AcrR family transcriptional regulator of autoinduction and epiphytic fitness
VNGPQPVEVAAASDAPEVEPVLDEPVVDGRTARAARTRDAIADAMLDLLADGHLRPTAKEIAERAGVSVRSVYVHFEDLEDLFCVAANRHFARIAPMLTPAPATGSLPERADALVLQRIRLYAKTGAIGRATRLNAEFSPTLARIMRDVRTRSRADLERVFAQELCTFDDARRANAVAVLEVLTGPGSWQTLREHHGLDVDRARQCVADAIVVHLEGRRP